MAIYKNKGAQKIAVFAVDASGDPKTGDAAQITAQISKDGAATAATNDANPTELDATDAPGIYIFDMLQAETNADLVVLQAASSTADITIRPVIAYTEPEQRVAASVTAEVVTDAASRAASKATGFNVVVPDAAGTAAVPGDAMTLTGAYDAAKTAAQAGALTTVDTNVDAILVDTNELQTNQGAWATAVGFSTHAAADVWSVGARTLTSFGTLVADTATAVWAAVTRTLTSGAAPSAADVADAVWDEAIADHVAAASFGEQTAKEGAGGDTLETLSDQLDGVGGAGSGDVAVDHDNDAVGGGDLKYLDGGGNGIDGADVRAYVKSEYDAGGRVVRGQATTNSLGEWAYPMYLNSGITYTIHFYKNDAYGTSTKDIEVS